MLKIFGVGVLIILGAFAFLTSGKVSTVEFTGDFSNFYFKEIFTNSGEALKEKQFEEKDLLIEEKIKHIETPENVKSLYYTALGISDFDRRQKLYDMIETTEINSVVIDIKTVSGYTSFEFDSDSFSGNIIPESNNQIVDIKSLIEELHEKDIYLIARLVVFKDKYLAEKYPEYALKRKDNGEVWTDYKGMKFLDPASKDVWDYNIEIASKAYELGFDEINFDYVRFPSDGNISNIYYEFENNQTVLNQKFNKIKVLDNFSNYLSKTLKLKYPEIKISADVFGLVTKMDMYNIGQNLESFVLNFDYVSPMIYPSHYGAGYLGYDNPDNYPYEIVSEALKFTNQRIDKLNLDIKQSSLSGTLLTINNGFISDNDLSLFSGKTIDKKVIRPWIQGFSCTRCKDYIPYNREKFRKQIDAIIDSGLDSFLVWNSASNYYESWYKKKEEAVK